MVYVDDVVTAGEVKSWVIATMMSPHKKVYYQSGATARVPGPSFPTLGQTVLESRDNAD